MSEWHNSEYDCSRRHPSVNNYSNNFILFSLSTKQQLTDFCWFVISYFTSHFVNNTGKLEIFFLNKQIWRKKKTPKKQNIVYIQTSIHHWWNRNSNPEPSYCETTALHHRGAYIQTWTFYIMYDVSEWCVTNPTTPHVETHRGKNNQQLVAINIGQTFLIITKTGILLYH